MSYNSKVTIAEGPFGPGALETEETIHNRPNRTQTDPAGRNYKETDLIPNEQIPAVSLSVTGRSASSPHLHFIDGLRGLAMLLVLFYHCWLFGGEWSITLPLGSYKLDVAPIFGYGHIGVNLFLVLSGFCLYLPFVKNNKRREPTLWEFAKKRCRRILPPYYVTLALFGGGSFLSALHRHDPAGIVYSLNWLWMHGVMAQNLRPDYVLTINGSLWSLALESQLYILFPVLVEAYRRFSARGVLWTVFILCSVYRFCLVRGDLLPDDAYGYVLAYSIFGRGFEFALGMFTALLVARHLNKPKLLLLPSDFFVAALVALLAFLDGRHGHFQTFTDAMWGLLFAALLLAGSRTGTLFHLALSNRFLVRLGLFSYSVYLIHLPLILLLGEYAKLHFSNAGRMFFMLLFAAPLMLGLGYLFHLRFERPFMSAPQPRPVP